MNATAARMERLRRAILNRIGREGDTDIRLACRSVVALLDWAGIYGGHLARLREREEVLCDVPAFLLESLVTLSVPARMRAA